MSLREAWALSAAPYAEVSFQAIYGFRLGSLPPSDRGEDLVPRAQRRIAQSKAVVTLVLVLLAAGAGALLWAGPTDFGGPYARALPPAVFDAGVLTGLFSLDVSLLWWTGLQVLPSLLASGAIPVLETLPIDEKLLRRTAGVAFLRLFDVPILAILVGTPLFVGLALGPEAGAAAFPGALTTVVFALALALLTGRFFVRRIQGSRGGGGRTAVRWAYLLLWLLPAMGILGFITAAPAFFGTLTTIAANPSPSAWAGLLVAYPFPLAALPAVAAHGTASLGTGGSIGVALAGSVAGYLLLAVFATAWLPDAVRSVARLPARRGRALSPTRTDLRPASPARAVLVKDLRIASRNPAYAFLFLLPLLDAAALGVVTVVDAPGPSAAMGLALGAVTAGALLATFFAPAFFSIEVLAQAYGRTLPLARRSLLVGKLSLVVIVYLAASGLVLALTLVRVPQPLLFAGFIAAELPSVAAAALLELALLFRASRFGGVPVPNLYAGAWSALLLALPGVAVAAAPLFAFGPLGLAGMAAVAVGELAVVLPLAARGGDP